MDRRTDEAMLEAAQVVERECFWGDYRLTAPEIVSRLEADDESFRRLVFSKIVDNSSHPSRFLRSLFGASDLRALVDEATKRATGRRAERLRLIERNLFGTGPELAAYAWRR